MPFVEPISEADASGDVAELYEAGKAQFGYLPNMHKGFSLRPDYWAAWAPLLDSIKGRMDARRYEVATVAAATALKSSYCALAHGQILAREILSEDEVVALVSDPDGKDVDPMDRAVFRFAQDVVRDASSISEDRVVDLKSHGIGDGEICDIVAAASVRCFFSKYLDALGFVPDATYSDMPNALRQVLTVGRDIERR